MTRFAAPILLLSLLAAGGCKPAGTAEAAECANAIVCPDSAGPARPDAIVSLNALNWTQTSTEFRGLTEQTYFHAKAMLDTALADSSWIAAPEQVDAAVGDLPAAVIMDLDETVIDNSPYMAWLVRENRTFEPTTWDQWCEAREATFIPGARDFIEYATERGVTVFYISNRTANAEQATIDNLVALGLDLGADPDARVLLRGELEEWNSSNKGTRRVAVAATHRIVLSVGDNMGDFMDDVKGTVAERTALYERYAGWWGTRFIVLPNPQYGSWDGALYGNNEAQPAADKINAKVDGLIVWTP